mmetsp:Transcript_103815/g.180320  ORF Transcript_103815/g.180320 Transcript_103815/m.180320 type:complete len:200 (+) Transcript_103815:427-1026(+)
MTKRLPARCRTRSGSSARLLQSNFTFWEMLRTIPTAECGTPIIDVPESTTATQLPGPVQCAAVPSKAAPLSRTAQCVLPMTGTSRKMAEDVSTGGLIVSQPGFAGPRSKHKEKRRLPARSSSESSASFCASGTMALWPSPTMAEKVASFCVHTFISVSRTCQNAIFSTFRGELAAPMRTVSKPSLAVMLPPAKAWSSAA